MNNYDDPFPHERKEPYSEMTSKVVPVHSRILTKKECMEALMLRRKIGYLPDSRGKVRYEVPNLLISGQFLKKCVPSEINSSASAIEPNHLSTIRDDLTAI